MLRKCMTAVLCNCVFCLGVSDLDRLVQSNDGSIHEHQMVMSHGSCPPSANVAANHQMHAADSLHEFLPLHL